MLPSDDANVTLTKSVEMCKWIRFGEPGLASVKHGSWCPKCAHATKRLHIDTAHREALSRGGLLISESKAYENNLSSLIWLWQCAQGHDSNLEQREDGKTWGPLCHKKDKTENELGAVLWPQCLEVVQSVLPDVWR